MGVDSVDQSIKGGGASILNTSLAGCTWTWCWRVWGVAFIRAGSTPAPKIGMDLVLAGCRIRRPAWDGLDVVLAGAGRDRGGCAGGMDGRGVVRTFRGSAIYFQVVI